MEVLGLPAVTILIVSLRIIPTFAFAPPFTLLRIPSLVRVLSALALSAWLVSIQPNAARILDGGGALIGIALSELLLGVALAIALHLAFAALMTAGRAIDFQAGFGLAVIADPTLRTQIPLVGALFSYAAGAVFFLTNGPADLLGIWSLSLERMPLGAYTGLAQLDALGAYMSTVFTIALGLAGIVIAALFLADMAIALMSRTLPQMNVLVLGFQVKTIVLLLTLPFVFTLSSALFLRLVRLALEATPQIL